MTDTLETTCRECHVPIVLPTGGLSAKALGMLRAFAAGLMCEPCSIAADEAEVLQRNRDAQGKADDEYAARLKQSGVPHLPSGFEWPETEAGAEARAWAQRRSSVLVLTGPVGSGKTTLAVAAFRERMRPKVDNGVVISRPGAWRSATAFMAALGSGFGSKLRDEAAELAQGGFVLGLDDLDKTRPSEYAAEQMFALIDGAVASRAPLVVTMNASLGALASRWGGTGSVGDAIASRLAEGVVLVDGPDRRMGRAA